MCLYEHVYVYVFVCVCVYVCNCVSVSREGEGRTLINWCVIRRSVVITVCYHKTRIHINDIKLKNAKKYKVDI